MASMDVTCHVGLGITSYGELLIDDLATEDRTMPDRLGYQIGMRLDRKLEDMTAHARIEYTRVRRFTYATYYGQNFTYRGRPLGFALGPDVGVLWAEGSLDLSRDWSIRSTAEFANEGEGEVGDAWQPSDGYLPNSGLSGTVEHNREIWAELTWLPREQTSVSFGIGHQTIRNPAHIPDQRQSAFLGRLALEARY